MMDLVRRLTSDRGFNSIVSKLIDGRSFDAAR